MRLAIKRRWLTLGLIASAIGYSYGANFASNDPCVQNPSLPKCQCPQPGGTVANGCVWVRMAMGELPGWSSLNAPFLQIYNDDPRPSLYTPSALTFSCDYAIYELSYEQTSGGVPRDVIMAEDRGIRVKFRFVGG